MLFFGCFLHCAQCWRWKQMTAFLLAILILHIRDEVLNEALTLGYKRQKGMLFKRNKIRWLPVEHLKENVH